MEISNNFSPIDIATSGLRAQSKQMELITANITNIHTTDAGGGRPYRRQEAVFKAEEEGGGVVLDEVMKDMTAFKRILKPGHPNADKQGYVLMPNVDLGEEMINLSTATRAYQASAASLKRYQQMVETSLELLG